MGTLILSHRAYTSPWSMTHSLCAHTHTHTHTHAHTHKLHKVYVFTELTALTHQSLNTHTNTHTHTHTHTQMHTHKRTRVVCMQALLRRHSECVRDGSVEFSTLLQSAVWDMACSLQPYARGRAHTHSLTHSHTNTHSHKVCVSLLGVQHIWHVQYWHDLLQSDAAHFRVS